MDFLKGITVPQSNTLSGLCSTCGSQCVYRSRRLWSDSLLDGVIGDLALEPFWVSFITLQCNLSTARRCHAGCTRAGPALDQCCTVGGERKRPESEPQSLRRSAWALRRASNIYRRGDNLYGRVGIRFSPPATEPGQPSRVRRPCGVARYFGLGRLGRLINWLGWGGVGWGGGKFN